MPVPLSREELEACAFRVQVGQLRLYEDDQPTKVVEIVRHPRYNKSLSARGGADIALLKLEAPVPLSELVHPVSLPPASLDVPSGKTCWVTGWGDIGHGGQEQSPLGGMWGDGLECRCGPGLQMHPDGFLLLLRRVTTGQVVQSSRNCLSHGSGGETSKLQAWAGLVPFRGPEGESVPCLLGFWDLCPSPCPWACSRVSPGSPLPSPVRTLGAVFRMSLI